MYLAIRSDKSPIQISENISVADMLAVKEGLLAAYRFNSQKSIYQRLVINEDKAAWEPVREAQALKTGDARLHH